MSCNMNHIDSPFPLSINSTFLPENMRQEKIIFEQALQKATFYWKYTGMQIYYNKKTKPKSIFEQFLVRWFYVGNFICLTAGVLSVFTMWDVISLENFLYMTPCMTFSFLGDIKSFYFLYYEDVVCNIINTLKNLQSIDDSEGKERVIDEFVKKRLMFLNAANKSLLFMSYMGIATFCFGPLLIISWQYWRTTEIKLFLPFFVWYPFDEHRYHGWPIAFFHQIWSTSVAVFFVYGADCFFYTACAFIHNQFCSLQFDMEQICQKTVGHSFNTHIQVLVFRHKELIRCVEMLNVIYGRSTLYNVLSSSLIICLAGFNVMAVGNVILMMPFAAVLFLGFIQIFLFCYYGDLIMCAIEVLTTVALMERVCRSFSNGFENVFLTYHRVTSTNTEITKYWTIVVTSFTLLRMNGFTTEQKQPIKSKEVSDALFNSKWYELDTSSRKSCLFILLRAQKPCKITAFGFSDINLSKFARILSSSWSYFTLLKTVYSK